RIAERVGPFDERLDLVMDYDYWVRIFGAGGRVATMDQPLAQFRVTPMQKSSQKDRVRDEILQVVREHLSTFGDRLSWRRRLTLSGDWTYQCRFTPELDHSVAAGEGRWKRALRTAAELARSPALFCSEHFRTRIRHNFLG